MEKGIYTLANDLVYDQLVALLNSVEANYSKDMSICIIPYDSNIKKVETEVEKRKFCSIFQDVDSIRRWEEFAHQAWSIYSRGVKHIFGRHKLSNHRKFSVFDGPFDKFVFMDADTILMQPLDFIFDKLDDYDFVVYDYQHKDPSHVYNVKSPKLFEIFSREHVYSEIFCTGFFASKKRLFKEESKDYLLDQLKKGEIDILYPKACEQSLLNYMVMKTNISQFNFALDQSFYGKTGNSVTSAHFENKGNILYDKSHRLTYLHYIGIPAGIFSRICKEENIDFPYRDIFLHYRYLHEPKKKPVFEGKPKPYNQSVGPLSRIWSRLKQ